MPTAATLERFIARVESNAHVEAIQEFYTEGASMQENMAPPRVGRDTLVAHEAAALTRTWKDDSVGRIEELAYQRWEGEKIAQEQFFYDPKQFVRG